MALFDDDKAVFRKYVPIVMNFTLAPLLPYLDSKAQEVLPQFLGDELTEQLLALPGTGDSDAGAAVLDKALELTRRAVAGICVAERLPFLEVQIADDGITVSATDGRRAAFEYQTTKVQKLLADSGWNALDKLIGLIDTNDDLFAAWIDAPYYAEYRDSLFKSAADFSRYYGIQNRWLTFWALCPSIRAIQDGRAGSVVARIEALPDQQADAGKKEQLTRKLKRAVAYQAVIDAMPTLSVELNGANVQVNYSGQFANNSYAKAADPSQLDWVMQNLQKQTDIFWNTVDTDITALLPADPSATLPDSSTGWLNDDDSTLVFI